MGGTSARQERAASETKESNAVAPVPVKKARKLSNKERAERDALPKTIETLEAEQAALTATLADPAFFKKPAAEVKQATTRLHEIEALLVSAYARWAELEG